MWPNKPSRINQGRHSVQTKPPFTYFVGWVIENKNHQLLFFYWRLSRSLSLKKNSRARRGASLLFAELNANALCKNCKEYFYKKFSSLVSHLSSLHFNKVNIIIYNTHPSTVHLKYHYRNRKKCFVPFSAYFSLFYRPRFQILVLKLSAITDRGL